MQGDRWEGSAVLWVVLLVLLTACSGGRADESPVEETIALFEEINEVLAQVSDRQSALVAQRNIASLADRMHALKTRRDASSGGLPEEAPLASDADNLRLAGVMDILLQNMTRIAADPVTREPLSDTFEELFGFFDHG